MPARHQPITLVEVQDIPDYMDRNICATVFSMFSFLGLFIGIAAIHKSSECQKYKEKGDRAKARKASHSAYNLWEWTVAVGITFGFYGGVVGIVWWLGIFTFTRSSTYV